MIYLKTDLIPDRFRDVNRIAMLGAGLSRRRAFFEDNTAQLSLIEAIDNRAQSLIASGKPLAVLWSGGVDSTLAAAALIRNEAPDLTFLMTPRSAEEYPLFYDRYVKGRAIIMDPGRWFSEYYPDNGITLYGEFDLLCGSKYGALGYYLAEKSWRDSLPADKVEHFEADVAAAERKISTGLDFHIWFSEFNRQTYSTVYYNTVATWATGSVLPFLDSQEIDRATIESDECWLPSMTYKHIAKQYIELLTGDSDYREKTKVYSLMGRAVSRESLPACITAEGVWLMTDEEAIAHAGL
ncbi:hypothetical protein DV711_06040 [Motiliproteus coralliicola]|uniref:Asparagine synthase n=1 Tax=Motiliproteus coralliicola TaxID=2283196 RepID=A0A369X016_9GAMM|nr:hypothetical protein [Motiliproteus coralliicola]RDE25115.1 hypothetical protein DV711_06040 [Motiliproteus coralliicola]